MIAAAGLILSGLFPVRLILVELQRRRIDAIALTSGIGAIVEDVAEVGLATATLHFRPAHAMRDIVFLFNGLLVRGGIKAGPARS